MPIKRTTKRTAQIVPARPMTCAEAFEAGRRAYESAADGFTGASVTTAEPQPCQSRCEGSIRAGPMADDRMTWPGIEEHNPSALILCQQTSDREPKRSNSVPNARVPENDSGRTNPNVYGLVPIVPSENKWHQANRVDS
jgi:hypothetical protein